MERQEFEMSQVTVILRAEYGEKAQAVADQLGAVGMRVTNIDADNGVIEGDIESEKLYTLKTLEFVETARVTFNWIVENPGDGPPDEDAEEDPDTVRGE